MLKYPIKYFHINQICIPVSVVATVLMAKVVHADTLGCIKNYGKCLAAECAGDIQAKRKDTR